LAAAEHRNISVANASILENQFALSLFDSIGIANQIGAYENALLVIAPTHEDQKTR
jgi:hypothetical protein